MQTQKRRASKRGITIPLHQVGESSRLALSDIVLTLLANGERKAGS